jgi:hypothetical protein
VQGDDGPRKGISDGGQQVLWWQGLALDVLAAAS